MSKTYTVCDPNGVMLMTITNAVLLPILTYNGTWRPYRTAGKPATRTFTLAQDLRFDVSPDCALHLWAGTNFIEDI